ncbi:MAG: urease accessory protein UreF [Bacteroidota bacterium]
MGNLKILHLLQITDSALPVGGFAFSQGMESALKQGLIYSYEDVMRYLNSFMQQVITFDLPFIKSAHELYNRQEPAWDEIIYAYEAMLMNPALQKSSEIMGKNIISLFKEIHADNSLETIWKYFDQKLLAFHFPVAFGVICAALHIEMQLWIQAYYYTCLRDQVSAITRLGFMGPRAAQGLLSKLTATAHTWIEKQIQIPHYEQASRSAYMIDLAQLNHTYIYSKLFQN